MSYQICTNCVMDTSDKNIIFDENGICDHCIDFEKNTRLKWFPNDEGQRKLEKIIKKLR